MRNIDKVQFPMWFETTIVASDVGDTVELNVPPNFVLKHASVSVREVFDGTTPTIGITDNKTAPTEIIAPATSLGAVADTESSAADHTEYPSGGKIIIAAVNAGGTTTEGSADVLIEGYIKGRQNERYGA